MAYFAGQSYTTNVTHEDADGNALDAATVVVNVNRVTTTVQSPSLAGGQIVRTGAGTYMLTFVVSDPGDYVFELLTTVADGPSGRMLSPVYVFQ
jgi:hypothetical protein